MVDQGVIASSFKDVIPADPALARAAAIAVGEVLALKPGEKLLIITNPLRDVLEISAAVYDAAQAAGATPVVIVQGVKRQTDFADDAVIAAFESRPDALVSLSGVKMGKDRIGIATPYQHEGASFDHIFHYQLYGAKSLRAFWSPTVTKEIFARTVPIDYRLLRTRCAALKAAMERACALRVNAPGGTQVSLSLEGRGAFIDDGDFTRPGCGGNLPAGEVFSSPVVGSARGRIVFDGSMSLNARDIRLDRPIVAELEDGFITSISGGPEAAALLETVADAERRALRMEEAGQLPAGKGAVYARNARNLGEIGIGLNPSASISGNMLEDEKAMGTCHFAVGHNYDGDAPALIHLDGLVRSPTVFALMPDGGEECLMRDGLIEATVGA